MTVVSGKMDVLLPGEPEWKSYLPFETFIVPAGISFQVKTESESSYLCLYK
jgi:purine/pyrimidine-nucleoside phosphorylase